VDQTGGHVNAPEDSHYPWTSFRGSRQFDNLSWVNHLARKYTGSDFTAGKDGEHRYKVTIRVDSWTAQG
jgi:hypothetical protein